MSEFQNQILFITLMAAGSAMTTSTMKPSYQNFTVGSYIQDEYASYDFGDSNFKDNFHHPMIIRWALAATYGFDYACGIGGFVKSQTWDAKLFGINHGGKAFMLATLIAGGSYLVCKKYYKKQKPQLQKEQIKEQASQG